MDQPAVISFMIQQLTWIAPFLLIYVVAGGLAIKYWDRSRKAAVLTLVGASISIIATVGIFASQVYMMIHYQAGEIAQFMRGIWAVGNLCRAAGLALMVAAIFVDRPEAGPRDRYLRE